MIETGIPVTRRNQQHWIGFFEIRFRCAQGTLVGRLHLHGGHAHVSCSCYPAAHQFRPWYGLLIRLFGIASQFLYFLRPSQVISHVLPWINLLLPAIGLIVLFIGLARAFRRSAVYSGKIWGSGVTVIALLLLAGNVVLFRKTRDVPNSAGAPQVGQRLPEFTLSDSSGEQTSLSQLFVASAGSSQPKAVLLVFYRGYW